MHIVNASVRGNDRHVGIDDKRVDIVFDRTILAPLFLVRTVCAEERREVAWCSWMLYVEDGVTGKPGVEAVAEIGDQVSLKAGLATIVIPDQDE
ncbi:hypothetical protein WS62_17740 [Burkholderia sp. ABCPW 14]|nr:hypothetical protein WS62_17740 [Burkholderia sp. ABCPW 14]